MSFGPKTQREILNSKRVDLKEAYKSDLYLQKLLLDADHSYRRNKPVRVNRKKIIKILTTMKKDILFEKDPKISIIKNENDTFKDKYRDLKKNNNYVSEPNFNNLKDEYLKNGYKIPKFSPEKNNLFKINPLIEENNTNLINGLRLNLIEKGNINIAFKSMNYLNRLYNFTEKLLEKMKKKRKGIIKTDSLIVRNINIDNNNVPFKFDKKKNEEILKNIKILLKLIKIEVENFNKRHNKSLSSHQLNKIDKKKPNLKISSSKINLFNPKINDQSVKLENNYYFKGFSQKNKISNYSINKTPKFKNYIKTLSFNEEDDNLKLNLKNFTKTQRTNQFPKLKNNNLIFESNKKSRNNQNFFNSQKNETNYTINSSVLNTNSNIYSTFSTNKNNTIILENLNKNAFLENISNDLNLGEYQNVEKKLIKYLKNLKNLDDESIKSLIEKYDKKNIITNLKELKEMSNKKKLKDKIEKLYMNNHEINRIKNTLNKMKEKEDKISNFDKNYIKIINKEYL